MRKIPALLLSAAILYSVCGCDKAEKQNGSTERTIKSSGIKSPGRVWVQKEFVLSTFGGVPADPKYFAAAVATLKQAGFNYIETAWQPHQNTIKILEQCDLQGGIKVMAQDLDLVGGYNWTHVPYSPELVSRYLNDFGNYRSLGAIYIYDEPRDEFFSVVRDNTDDFEKRRPDLLGFTVILPSYSSYSWGSSTGMTFDKYVEKYIAEVNPPVLCSDYYPFQSDITPDKFYADNFWRDMGFLRKQALEHGLIHWFYYQARIPDGAAFTMRPEHIYVQAWAAVLYGVKGLSNFTAHTSAVDDAGQPGYLFEATKTINLQIGALGNTLLCLTSKAVYHGGKVNDPYADDISGSEYLASLPGPFSAGEFTDSQGNAYLLVLNRDFNTPNSASIPLTGLFRQYLCDKQDGGKQKIIFESATLSVALEAGQAQLFRLEKPEKEPSLITYAIE